MGTEHDSLLDTSRTAYRTCPLCEAGCGLDRADHEMPPQPDRVFKRLAVAEQRRDR